MTAVKRTQSFIKQSLDERTAQAGVIHASLPQHSLSVCLSVCLSVSLSLSLSHTHTHTHTHTRERERERERETETQTQTDRQTDTQREGDRQRQTGKQRAFPFCYPRTHPPTQGRRRRKKERNDTDTRTVPDTKNCTRPSSDEPAQDDPATTASTPLHSKITHHKQDVKATHTHTIPAAPTASGDTGLPSGPETRDDQNQTQD